MKKIIVTGGLGFIGSNLVDLLLKKNFFVINIHSAKGVGWMSGGDGGGIDCGVLLPSQNAEGYVLVGVYVFLYMHCILQLTQKVFNRIA